MMDLVLEAWVAGLIEMSKTEWLLGGGHSWKPGVETETALRGLQRNTQYRF